MSLIKVLALFALIASSNYLHANVIIPFALTVYSFTFWIHFLISMIIEYWVLWFLFKKTIESNRIIRLVLIMNVCSLAIGFGIAFLDDYFFLGITNDIVQVVSYMLFSFIGSVIINVIIESPIAIWLIPEIDKKKMIMYIAIANICSVGFYLISWGSLLALALLSW